MSYAGPTILLTAAVLYGATCDLVASQVAAAFVSWAMNVVQQAGSEPTIRGRA